MKVEVNRDRCETNALCVEQAPEIFEIGDDDEMHVVDDNPGEELRERLANAVRLCPKQAITVVEA